MRMHKVFLIILKSNLPFALTNRMTPCTFDDTLKHNAYYILYRKNFVSDKIKIFLSKKYLRKQTETLYLKKFEQKSVTFVDMSWLKMFKGRRAKSDKIFRLKISQNSNFSFKNFN